MSILTNSIRSAIVLALLSAASFSATAQVVPMDSVTLQAYNDTMRTYEDSLNTLTTTLFESRDQRERAAASYEIIRTLKTALLLPNSFYYPFDSLRSISVVTPEDSLFRIFTWQLIYNNNTYRYFGVIQMNSPEPVLHPLVDQSVFMEDVAGIETTNDRWYGVLYYGIKRVDHRDRTWYTVFGYDGNNALSTIKVADVLWFSDSNTVHFGAPLFDLGDGKPAHRYVMEFKKGVSAGLNFSAEHDKIVMDHLIPVNDESEGMYFNYVPDGSYDGFEWKNGRWVYTEKLYDFKLKDGEFPQGN